MLESCIAGLITGGARWLTNLRAYWLGCEPYAGPRIYYCNHSSHLDFILLRSALPRNLRSTTRPVAASEYWERVDLRRYIIHRVFHGVLVHRSEPEKEHSVSPMVQALDQRDSLILFPEGTRGAGDVLGQFKSGIFHLAQARPWVELIPVWISNSARVLPKGAYLPVPLLCSVTFGRPLHIRSSEGKGSFLKRLQMQLLELSSQ